MIFLTIKMIKRLTQVPDAAVINMKANFVLPEVKDLSYTFTNTPHILLHFWHTMAVKCEAFFTFHEMSFSRRRRISFQPLFTQSLPRWRQQWSCPRYDNYFLPEEEFLWHDLVAVQHGGRGSRPASSSWGDNVQETKLRETSRLDFVFFLIRCNNIKESMRCNNIRIDAMQQHD